VKYCRGHVVSLRFGFRLVTLLVFLIVTACDFAFAGGVTLITHGFNGNVTDWIIPMSQKIPPYSTFPGTNYSCYEISITQTSGVYHVTQTRLAGGPPLGTDSGEILIKLDWSTLSGGSIPTTTIATQAVNALLSTSFIPELGGRTLVELPLHLAGHSRGGSVVTEMARLLGAQGLWVDQVTTLDPHPVSAFGDPNVSNYANVLFADNYWQNLGDGLFVPNGQSVPGAYNRQLTNLDGGYSSSHSDAHLWYHGTIDLATPATDTGATITSAERATWWSDYEQAGTNAGFLYTLIGGGDRLSTNDTHAGAGRIRDGFNALALGSSVSSNRTSLTVNSAAWPNLLRLNLTGSSQVAPGDPIPLALFHQTGASTSATATVRFYLDPDHNPYNTNEILLSQTNLPGTGISNVVSLSFSPLTSSATTPPGRYWVFASITLGSHTRYLYAPQSLAIVANRQPPLLTGARFATNQFRFTVLGQPGQTIVVQASTDLVHWSALQTNVLVSTNWAFADLQVLPQRVYRAQLLP
jgi:hypothetical protein